MSGPARTSHARSFKSIALPWVVLAAGLALCLTTWHSARRELERQDLVRFERLKERVLDAIEDRFQAAEQALFGGRALVESTGELSEVQWARYVESVWPFFDHGVVGLGYVQRLPRTRLDEVEARIRAQGRPNFTAEREGTNPDVFLVTHLEPLARNALALGKDIGAGTTRRTAAERAMRTGAPAITRKINLIEGSGTVPGCLLFLPVYSPGASTMDPPERERRLQGWVYASLRVDLLLQGVVGVAEGQLDIDAHDGRERTGEELLFDSRAAEAGARAAEQRTAAAQSFEMARPVYGRTWLLRFGTNRAFEQRSNRDLPGFVLLGGGLLSVSGALLTWTLLHKRAEALRLAGEMTASLRSAEAEARRLALVASRTASVVVLTDPAWRVQWVNAGFERFYGFTFDEIRGRPVGEVLSGRETDPATLAAIDAAARRGESFKGELLNFTKRREPRWMEVEMQPLKDEAGVLTGFMSLQLDITDRKRIQAEIVRKEAQFRFIFEAIPVGVSWRRVEADGTTTRLLNEAHLRICGCTREELAEPGAYRAISIPEEHEAQESLYRRLVAGEITSFSIEKRYRHRDGTVVWVVLSQQRRNYPDGAFEELSTQVDISEIKRQTAELNKAKDSAEAANQAKSQFLAMMSHEIRTPMNGVIGMTSLLLDSKLSRDQRDYVETIRTSGDALLTIINDILDFSKIESGRLELEKVDFALRECVEGALDLLAPRCAEKRIDLLYEIADGVPGVVRGDPTRLRQILVNLLGNAVKFTERGEVVLSLRVEPLDGGRVKLLFGVRDTGIGIPQDGMARLFQSFSQVDASTTRRFGGTGLGLVVSKRLAELMGGEMTVESEVGKGSTFHFGIVVEPVGSRPRPWLTASPANVAGRALLVVDDNATNRRILTELAQGWGMKVQAVSSGAEALRVLREGHLFEIAVLDMHMPEMDGSMLATEIRRLRTAEAMPLVMLSSLGARDTVADASLFGAFLTKPAKPVQLLETIASFFKSESTAARPLSTHPFIGTAVPKETRPDRLLLAEDNVVNQKVALLMLRKLGYRADVAADGHEALEAVQRQRYDVILMDVQMPEMDGLEASRQICARWPERRDRPWIIAITANAMLGDRESCLAAGMDDYITKPIKTEELAAALERARQAMGRNA